MKKTTILTLVTTGIIVASCGNNANNDNNQNDSLTVVSSKAETSIKEDVPYFSDDLKMFGLRGHVKKAGAVKNTPRPNSEDYVFASFFPFFLEEAKFTNDGKLIEAYKDPTVKKELNEDGFLLKYYCRESDATEFKLVYESIDDNGWPLIEKYSEEGPMSDVHITYTYEYVKVDERGNWIERNATYSGKYYVMDEYIDSNKPTTVNGKCVQTRTITYYD